MRCQTGDDALDIISSHSGKVSLVLPSTKGRKIFDKERTGDCAVDIQCLDVACLPSLKRMGCNACLSILGRGIGGNGPCLIGDDLYPVCSTKDGASVDR